MNLFDRLSLLSKASFIGQKFTEILPPDWEKKYGMECHIDHEENFPNNEKLFSETLAIPSPF